MAATAARAVCVVTGAGSGIGRATATLFAQQGAALVLTDINAVALDETLALIGDACPDAVGVPGDISDAAHSAAVVATAVDVFGSLDVYVANAGVLGTHTSFLRTQPEDMAATLAVNVVGTFLGIRDAAAAMMASRRGGSIVATASVAGVRSGAGPADYSASKAAVISLVQTAANEFAPRRVGDPVIRVNAVCPGLVETGMTAPLFNLARSRGTHGKIGQLNPTKRSGLAHEIANAVVWLASDSASYVNGQAVCVDGGLSSSLPVVPKPLLPSKL